MKNLLVSLVLATATACAVCAPVAVAISRDGMKSITLHDEKGPYCVEGAMRAEYMAIGKDGAVTTLEACWVAVNDESGVLVVLQFANGERATVPGAVFGKVKPANLT